VKKYYVRKKPLVLDTKVRMEGRLGIAGGGVGLLNERTAKQDSIASEEEGGCKILGFHSCCYEECCLLGCYAVSLF
jgi:hypothetical protein